MGKKKASKARILMPQIEEAISQGKIYIREKPSSFYNGNMYRLKTGSVVYEVCLGQDSQYLVLDRRLKDLERKRILQKEAKGIVTR
jgi:hypothetical protein